MKRRTFLGLSSLFSLSACSPLGLVNALAPEDGIEVAPDIAYGDTPRHMLDLYRPRDGATGELPTVLFLYGGSWKRGSRKKYAFAGRALARHGFLVAVADYRVYPEVRFPAFVDDAAGAVAWLTENAREYGGRNRGIHLVGHSAGAHIAAMVALQPSFLAEAGAPVDSLGAWAGLAGPYAFRPSEYRSIRAIFSTVAEDAARPVTFANGDAPPALLLHGGDDTTVYPSNSAALANALQAAGARAQARIYPGIGHAPIVLSLTDPFTGIAPTLADTVRFLKTGAFPAVGSA